jgi:glucose-1-phosphate cytidylyltransferase
MKVVILCGGKGYRLQEETEFKPKPLVPIGGRPILWHIMRNYVLYGYREFILCLGYRGDMIKDYFVNYDLQNGDITVKLGEGSIKYEDKHNENCDVTLAETGLNTMTGGRLKRIQKYINDDTFMVTYGDGVSDINIGDLLKYHNNHGKIATVSAFHPISRFGVLDLDRAGMVRRFDEKPIENDYINMGFFVLNKKIFDYLDGDSCVLEQEPLRKLAKEGELMAYKHEGVFHVMDTYRDYISLNEMWNKGEAKWIK